MSPSEKDLRASLRQGEGEPVDVDRIVAAGAAARSQRRTRLASVAAAVVLVVAAGSVSGILLTRDDGGTTSADGGGSAASVAESRADGAAIAPGEPAPGVTSGSAASRTGDTAARAIPPAACPATFPQRSLPGGPQAGALFDRVAVSITVCAYGSPLRTPNPASFTYSGARASELQRSLENAPSSPRGVSCDAVRAADKRELAFIAVDAAGKTMRVVTTTLSIPICDTRTTNGITVRYGWVPPLGARQQLYRLTQPGGPSLRVPSGKNTGSPVR